MFALAPTSRQLVAKASPTTRRRMSSVLEGDTGAIGTRIHHAMTTGLAIFTPLYMLTPDSYTDGAISKTIGLLLSVNITAHSWIGLNYVCRDYGFFSALLLPPVLSDVFRVVVKNPAGACLLNLVRLSHLHHSRLQISAKLLGPARIATAGLSLITLLGMARISISSPGGLKGVVKGLWTAPPAKKAGEYDY